ncbi:preprotein translocase subunit SecE [Auritidibacter ignavus]|uniref:preprotein translocase subunit SecE n=1 Tax=Auritidibacter TaxID=1160973 RepID=UPI000D72E225|nr:MULTISPECIES: preprotein translocase subunit SecE [Auritidibacter]PXA78201.1 preprotein translocase subunit SecE [Auritidibacter sp. NML100628]PXA79833.1 preprotein translocase subunit SecE [Auritidibacter sp. NML120779]AXR72988.1 preprotein translocase subunit SecE [Auritidibacter sp. NML130574]PXA80964.1 preprotein translocase subunit SecE [Auritidibacter sp. NML120636]RMX22453.1 preprotein translocase subunit SecE [Auritidibacter ignavus]
MTERGSVAEQSTHETQDGGQSRSERRGFFSRIMLFLRQVVDEIRKVVTPTREELLKMTGVVLVFVIIVIAVVFVLDWLFGQGASFLFGGQETV